MLGSINLLCEDTSTFTEEQQELIRISRICGEQLFVLINDVLGNYGNAHGITVF
jgi:hypothetical protein